MTDGAIGEEMNEMEDPTDGAGVDLTAGTNEEDQKDFKKMRPKLPILLLVLAAAIALIFASFFLKQKFTSASLSAKDNQFSLTFDLTKRDEREMAQFLTKLGISTETMSGFSFELDATSSAKLAFSLPVKADLTVDSKEITFSGKHNSPQLLPVAFGRVNLPKDANLAIYSPQMPYFLKQNASLPSEFADWLFARIDQAQPTILVGFVDDGSWILIYKWKTQPDFEELSLLKSSEPEDYYKKEMLQDRTFHLIKLTLGEEEKILTLIDDGDKAYLASSKEIALKLLDAQNAKDNPFPQSTQDIIFELSYKTRSDMPISKDLAALIVDNPNVTSKLEGIDQIRFLLKPQSFSGLIKLK